MVFVEGAERRRVRGFSSVAAPQLRMMGRQCTAGATPTAELRAPLGGGIWKPMASHR